jgi:hypothetical protein
MKHSKQVVLCTVVIQFSVTVALLIFVAILNWVTSGDFTGIGKQLFATCLLCVVGASCLSLLGVVVARGFLSYETRLDQLEAELARLRAPSPTAITSDAP